MRAPTLLSGRVQFVRPTPVRFAASAIGLAVAGLPSLSAHADARLVALGGVVAMLATVAVPTPGVSTFGCAAAMCATALASLHGAAAGLAIGDALLLMAYLLVSDVAAAPGQLRASAAALAVTRLKVFVAGAICILALGAVTFADLGGSFGFAIASVVAALVAVVTLRASSQE